MADTFDDQIVFTLQDTFKTVSDQVSNHNPATAIMEQKGRIRTRAGGSKIQIPLVYSGKHNHMLYEDANTQLKLGAQKTTEKAEFEYGYFTFAVVVDETHLHMNRGPTEIIDLMSTLMQAAVRERDNELNYIFYGAGNRVGEPKGLKHLVSDDGGGKVGDVDASTDGNEWWKNKVTQLTAIGTGGADDKDGENDGLDFQTVLPVFRKMANSLTQNMRKVDLILTDNEWYGHVQQAAWTNTRLMQDARLARLSFDNYLLGVGTPVVMAQGDGGFRYYDGQGEDGATSSDNDYTDGSTNYYNLKTHSGAYFLNCNTLGQYSLAANKNRVLRDNQAPHDYRKIVVRGTTSIAHTIDDRARNGRLLAYES